MASASSVPAKKPRDMTRIVMWTVVGLATLVMLYLYASPTSQTGHTHAKRPGQSVTVASADQNAITPEDLTAHFPRYAVGKRDPFIPLIATSASANSGSSSQGEWLLTGISSINGVPSALVENSATGESAFLTDGESWRGLKVKSIRTDAIIFENTLGQETTLAFDDTGAGPATPSAGAGAPSSSLPTASDVRPLPQVGSLPPLPVPTNPVRTNAAPAATAPTPSAQTATPQESPIQQ